MNKLESEILNVKKLNKKVVKRKLKY